MISHAEGVEPLWIQQCPAPDDHVLPYCGEAIQQASRKMACTAAYADALGKLRRSIGQKVEARLAPDGQGGYRFEIQGAESEPLTIRGAWEDQRWYEEYEGPGGHTYDCYVMLVYPRLQYDNLLGMARKATVDRVAKASALHQEGRGLAGEGRHAEAADLFERAKALLDGLREPVVTPDGSLNSDLLREQVTADLRAARDEAGKVSRTALVVVQLVVDGRPAPRGALCRSLRNKLKNRLSRRGVRIRPGGLAMDQVAAVLAGDRVAAARTAAGKGAGLLLVLEIESEYLAYEESIHYAEARGAFRLIRTADGREVAAADLGPEKQGHPVSRKGALMLSVEKLRDKTLAKVVDDALGRI